jgi:hypothetical protein
LSGCHLVGAEQNDHRTGNESRDSLMEDGAHVFSLTPVGTCYVEV